jgi:hypothetical protein
MKKLYPQLILSILFCSLSSSPFAQELETGKIKELYLSGSLLNFSNFGLQYKSELKHNNFFRLGFTGFNYDYEKLHNGSPNPPSGDYVAVTHISGRFEVGLEKRKQITDKLTAFHGINFITSTRFQRNKLASSITQDLGYLDDFSITTGLGFNFGFIFKIAGDFSISAEIIPELVYKYSSTERIVGPIKVKDSNKQGSFNIDNESVRVSFLYQWHKK